MTATAAAIDRQVHAKADIITALEHPQVFAAHFRGPSWQPWRVFLRALFALPMANDELAIYQRHTDRTTAPTMPFREAALVVGRRGGKSRILALIAVSSISTPSSSPRAARSATNVRRSRSAAVRLRCDA